MIISGKEKSIWNDICKKDYYKMLMNWNAPPNKTQTISAANNEEFLTDHWSVSRWDWKIDPVMFKALSEESSEMIFLCKF